MPWLPNVRNVVVSEQSAFGEAHCLAAVDLRVRVTPASMAEMSWEADVRLNDVEESDDTERQVCLLLAKALRPHVQAQRVYGNSATHERPEAFALEKVLQVSQHNSVNSPPDAVLGVSQGAVRDADKIAFSTIAHRCVR